MIKKVSIVFLTALFILLGLKSMSQQASFYFTQPQHQAYLEYLINSGRVKVQHPLSQPYLVSEIKHATDSIKVQKKGFARHLKQDIQSLHLVENNSEKWLVDGNGGYLSGKEKGAYINGGTGYLHKQFALRYQYTYDQSYAKDPLYFGTSGKLQKPNSSRSNEAYMEIRGKNISFMAGRLNRNFGIINESGLLLSGNAFSYDQLSFSYTNERLLFTTLFTRLEDLDAFDIRDAAPDTFKANRFLSVHRLELKINPNLHIGVTESVIFGGRDAFPQLKYISPSSIFFLSKMNDRKNDLEGSANALMSIDILYKPSPKWTLYAQGLVDDVDFTKSLRAVYPDRVGVLAKLIMSDPFPASQLSVTYTKLSNWTYNSFYTWGNYTYYGKGIGHPQHGVERIELNFNHFGYSTLMLKGKLGYERYRKQDLAAPFIAQKTIFPIGVPVRNFFVGGSLQWFPNRHVLLGAEMQLNSIRNFDHILAPLKQTFEGAVSVKLIGISNLIDKK